MADLAELLGRLRRYDGPPATIMEVCGTHTGVIASLGLRSLLPASIRLVSGPGCPVCVTVTSYIDRLCALSLQGHTILTFGDLMRVQGSRMSLQDAAAQGGQVHMLYAPAQALELAKAAPERAFIFAAVGFETTAPLYALLLQEAQQAGLRNLQLLTSLKTMPPVLRWVCAHNAGIDGFIAPGHVSVITGSDCFGPLSREFGLPFVVAGFDAPQIVGAVYTLLQHRGAPGVYNLYRSAVTSAGNLAAQQLVQRYFTPGDATWRGVGELAGSGLYLREEYAAFDAGSRGLDADAGCQEGCICSQILTGSATPAECPLFGTMCTPERPRGACMVSSEGCCACWYKGRGGARI